MKTLKVKSILFSLLAVMAVTLFMTSCNKEEIVISDSLEKINKEGNEKRKWLLNPCGGPNSGEVVPHITDEIRCIINWGFIWEDGQCWACY